jgi:hypothetical protein
MVSSVSIRTLQEKAEEINLVLLQPNVDLWKLRELALTEGGLVNGALPVNVVVVVVVVLCCYIVLSNN